MKNSINQINLQGHVGFAPEKIALSDNKVGAKFSLATNDAYKNKAGEWVKQTQWHKIIVWGKQAAKVLDRVQKGAFLKLEGQLQYRNFENKSGFNQTVAEIRATQIFLENTQPETPAA